MAGEDRLTEIVNGLSLEELRRFARRGLTGLRLDIFHYLSDIQEEEPRLRERPTDVERKLMAVYINCYLRTKEELQRYGLWNDSNEREERSIAHILNYTSYRLMEDAELFDHLLVELRAINIIQRERRAPVQNGEGSLLSFRVEIYRKIREEFQTRDSWGNYRRDIEEYEEGIKSLLQLEPQPS